MPQPPILACTSLFFGYLLWPCVRLLQTRKTLHPNYYTPILVFLKHQSFSEYQAGVGDRQPK
jgi:hypothetical protein